MQIDDKNLTPDKDLHISEEKFKTIALCNYLIKPDNNVVFLDTETSGFAGFDKVCELTVLNSKNEVLFDQMFNLGTTKMNPEASAISGITDEMLQDKPSFSQYSQQIKDLLKDKVIVAWNTSFDLRLLKQTFKDSGMDVDFGKENLWFDAQKITQDYFGTKVKLKQAEVMQCLQFDHIENHRAEDDVKDMIKIIAILANEKNVDLIPDIQGYITQGKAEAMEIERKYGTTGVKTSTGRKPGFVKYVEEWLQTKDINSTANKFGVSQTTVKTNLMKAMIAQELPYQQLTRQLTPQQQLAAINCLASIGYTDKTTIFTDFAKNCGGLNYNTYVNAASRNGLHLEDLYDAALRAQLGIN
jgi:hypothetical protein